MTGIASYGVYIPKYRLKIEEIARVWGKDPHHIEDALGVEEKSIAGHDEDTVTLGYEAAWRALKSAGVPANAVEALFVGSESHPYAVNPTTTIIGSYLEMNNNYYSADIEFACKAATTGMIVVDGLLKANKITLGMTIGADCAQAKPHDILEYTAASAGVAILLSNKPAHIIAELIDSVSYTSDTPDFWRRDGMSYPSHGGRFTGEPAYFAHVYGACSSLFLRRAYKTKDIDYCVFHMPNGKFPRQAAKHLGFSAKQIEPSLVVDHIGNAYSATALLGLASVLDQAKPNKTILLISYGSGAGSDAFIFKTTKHITEHQKHHHSVLQKIQMKQYITYTDYLKMRGKI